MIEPYVHRLKGLGMGGIRQLRGIARHRLTPIPRPNLNLWTQPPPDGTTYPGSLGWIPRPLHAIGGNLPGTVRFVCLES